MFRSFVFAVFFALTSAFAIAQTAEGPKEWVAAEVRKVDKEGGKVTLKHAEIKSLDMPQMTMVFRVKDEKLWSVLTEGAKVKIGVEKAMIGYNVTHAQPEK
jgi:Cu(I)/Ag(I) efflux system periplasmic protein CusF